MPCKYLPGLSLNDISERIALIEEDESNGKVEFRVDTNWQGSSKSRSVIRSYVLGGEEIPRQFEISMDAPQELFGTGDAPNPQEILLSAINACMISGYAAFASMLRIKLEKIEIKSVGEINLRGFLGLDLTTKPGYENIKYSVDIKGSGTHEQFEMIHDAVMTMSPNLYNMEKSIRLSAELNVL